MLSRTVVLGALACALSLSTAACGSSKSNTSASPAPAPSASAPSAAPDSYSSSSSSAPVPAPSTTTAPAGASGGSDADFCKLGGPGNAALSFAAATEGDADVGKLRHDLAQAEALAPGEIAPDIRLLASIEIPILDGKVPQGEIDQKLEDPRVTVAMEHIANWSLAHCKR